MKFSLFALVPLIGFAAAGPLAAPAPEAAEATAVKKRQTYSFEMSTLEKLYDDIREYTAVINATANGLAADADITQKDDAASAIHSAMTSITSLILGAKSTLDETVERRRDAPLEGRDVEERQLGGAAVAALVVLILLEISGTLNLVIAALGLGALLGFLNPLTGALSGLVATLALLVYGLVELVQTLLTGLLLGLSVALAGLSF